MMTEEGALDVLLKVTPCGRETFKMSKAQTQKSSNFPTATLHHGNSHHLALSQWWAAVWSFVNC